MDPLPIETQRDSLAPTGERASAAFTCASVHACGSVFAESDMKTGRSRRAQRVPDNRQNTMMKHDSQSTELCNGNLLDRWKALICGDLAGDDGVEASTRQEVAGLSRSQDNHMSLGQGLA